MGIAYSGTCSNFWCLLKIGQISFSPILGLQTKYFDRKIFWAAGKINVNYNKCIRSLGNQCSQVSGLGYVSYKLDYFQSDLSWRKSQNSAACENFWAGVPNSRLASRKLLMAFQNKAHGVASCTEKLNSTIIIIRNTENIYLKNIKDSSQTIFHQFYNYTDIRKLLQSIWKIHTSWYFMLKQ